jgi:F-type H+-transporting ATPase subunit epsilon
MAADNIELVVVTPAKQLLRRNVMEVTLPGAEGCIGVLPGHAPLITALGVGELNFHDADGKEAEHLSIIRGFAEVLPNRVTLLAETAEFAAEIDIARAEEARARAEKRLSSGDTNIDWDRASVALQRALIRIQVARKYRGTPSAVR